MAIDASIPLQGIVVDVGAALERGMRLRAMREQFKNAREDRQRENEARTRLSDLMIAQDHMRSAGSYGDAPGGAPVPTADPSQQGVRRLGDLLPGAAGPQGPTLGAAMSRSDEFNPAPQGGVIDERGATQAGGGVEQMRKEAMQRGYEAAWQALVRADPEGAFKVRKSQFDNAAKEIEIVGTLTAGVQDQATYDNALERARSYGLDTSNMPPQYNPDMVHAFTMQAAGAANALSAMRSDRRLQWDMEDDQADNERADRVANSQIDYRQQRLEDFDNAEAGRNRRAANRPKPASKGPQSEGALYASIRSRFNKGEAITEREQQFLRDFEARKNRTGRANAPAGGKSSGYGDGAIIKNPRTGERMRLEGGKWVPVK